MLLMFGLLIVLIIFSYCFGLIISALTALSLILIRQAVVADADIILTLLDTFGPNPGVRLHGRVIWITGASRGIGAALAVRLAECGSRLVLSARDQTLLDEVKLKCMAGGCAANNVLVLPLDITQHDQHQAALDAVLRHYGQLSVLVSNAGRSQRARWDAIEMAVDKELFELNVFSLVALARVVNGHFKKIGGGQHAIMSSTAGKIGAPRSASYTASKHALHGYFECLRIEGASDNIDVTMLCPGPVDSTLLQHCYTEQLGQPLSMERAGRRMSAARCATLCSVAISHRLPEVWITEQPVLALQYVVQYCPMLVFVLLRVIGIGAIMKMRDGRPDTVPSKALQS